MDTSILEAIASVETGLCTKSDLAFDTEHCGRCGGLLLHELCTDLLDDTGRMDFPAWRCVQCGNLVDSVILLNRQRRPQADERHLTKWAMKHRESDSVH